MLPEKPVYSFVQLRFFSIKKIPLSELCISLQEVLIKFVMVAQKSRNKYPAGGWLGLVALVSL
jgi:hypothetical protein